MGSTASKTVALVIALSKLLVAPKSGIWSLMKQNRLWGMDWRWWNLFLVPCQSHQTAGHQCIWWMEVTYEDRTFFEDCALGNKNRRQYLKDKEIAISNGEVPALRNGWWKLKYKEKDCKEEWESEEKDIRALEESKRYIRYCFTEDKQKVCLSVQILNPIKLLKVTNTKGEVKRYFRWWTQWESSEQRVRPHCGEKISGYLGWCCSSPAPVGSTRNTRWNNPEWEEDFFPIQNSNWKDLMTNSDIYLTEEPTISSR